MMGSVMGATGFGPPIYYVGAAYGLAAIVIGAAIVLSLLELSAWARRARALERADAADDAAGS